MAAFRIGSTEIPQGRLNAAVPIKALPRRTEARTSDNTSTAQQLLPRHIKQSETIGYEYATTAHRLSHSCQRVSRQWLLRHQRGTEAPATGQT
jgi:hypothetical protein